VGIEEEAVGSPRVWLDTPIEVIIRWYLGQMAIVFFPDMFFMFSVFSLNVAYPSNDGNS
jgi:hypothetical protein